MRNPFTWTAAPDEIIAKAKFLHRDFKKLLPTIQVRTINCFDTSVA
jgi:hypothetical protein